jgi:hypothetical protein
MTLTAQPQIIIKQPVIVAAGPVNELLPVPQYLMDIMRQQYAEGQARGVDPRYSDWETFVAETLKDSLLGNPYPWAGEG